MSDKSRDPSKDYRVVGDVSGNNTRLSGIWSDGTVIYVGTPLERKIYAYAVHAP